jgi:hypothetical protein
MVCERETLAAFWLKTQSQSVLGRTCRAVLGSLIPRELRNLDLVKPQWEQGVNHEAIRNRIAGRDRGQESPLFWPAKPEDEIAVERKRALIRLDTPPVGGPDQVLKVRRSVRLPKAQMPTPTLERVVVQRGHDGW